MKEDVRDKPGLEHEDVLRLNFIISPGIFLYRQHYRAGLRSHIMEVLSPKDVAGETAGVIIDGLKHFPRARPLKMLRIFRTRFNSLRDAEEELKRIKIVGKHLAPDYIARSDEFLVHYARHGKYELLLCGLQEYVEGEVIDPWSHLDENHLVSLLSFMGFARDEDLERISNRWIRRIREKAEHFIDRLKQMIAQSNHVPDLAGVGNLILTRFGNIKLVDINNISRVSFNRTIPLDDRGYPVCDKSIEALSLMEQKLLCRSLDRGDPVYNRFLDPERMKDVKEVEKRFHILVTEDHEGPGAGQYIHRY